MMYHNTRKLCTMSYRFNLLCDSQRKNYFSATCIIICVVFACMLLPASHFYRMLACRFLPGFSTWRCNRMTGGAGQTGNHWRSVDCGVLQVCWGFNPTPMGSGKIPAPATRCKAKVYCLFQFAPRHDLADPGFSLHKIIVTFEFVIAQFD
jgi:hypothetical protein